ncbi:hypothetical protein SAMN04244572_03734 [Azotobacter beijerinckii]|uniref:Uncharacterized protein n=1 Tax=Azotobacter beijerinckii TaxID=170623 RepID=A0A1H6Y903_9GAMM|nr:hypothetical protein [Azotobacter beijerinckii]SEJ37763.1 hypothetical protein SAMN04244572_03734 [Azotobacter beijerinckii]
MSNHLQVLREHLRWLETQPDDYRNGHLDKAALLTMTTEALASVEALERAAELVTRYTLSGEAWVSPVPARALDVLMQLIDLGVRAEAGSEAAGLALDAEDLMLRTFEEELELGEERLAEVREADGAPGDNG